jgi:hypothetical protein
MKRRRHRLEVSTFPFLAVLLCAMGSLILLLLVLDRRAKIVALRKVREAAGQAQRQAEELERQAAERHAAWERRQQQLHALLAQQEQELLGQVQQVRGQVEAAADKAQAEQVRSLSLKEQLSIVNARLFGSEQAAQAQQQAAAQAAQQTEEAQRELARQAADLLLMEQALANLKALRERQKQTYSLVPYFGKRGDNRRPIYVECAASGLVFHPDRLSLEGYQLTPQRVRAEVEQRIARQTAEPAQGAGQPALPYLLMLVRPDGIMNYYRTQQALVGMKVDFGYEFVEQDWVFDFEGDSASQPWPMTAKAPPAPIQVPPPPTVPRLGGMSGVAGAPRDQGATSGQPAGGSVGNGPRPPGNSSNPAKGAAPSLQGEPSVARLGGPPSVPGLPQLPGGGGSATALGGMSQGQGEPSVARLGGPPPVPGLPQFPGGGGSAAPPGSMSRGQAGPGGALPKPVEESQDLASSGASRGPVEQGEAQQKPQEKPSGLAGPAGMAAGLPPTAAAGPSATQTQGTSPGQGTSAIPGGVLGAKVAGPPAPLGRLLANHDWIIYIECSSNAVVVKQGNQKFTLESLTAAGKGEHPLTQALRHMIARRQATVRTGEPPYRPMLRFQVQPEGLRSYYLAYPLLAPLGVPMTRENVE